MREVEFLHYRPGTGPYFAHDPRLKLLELALWSILALVASPATLALVFGILIALHTVSGSRLKRLWRPLVFWVLMAAVITVSAGLNQRNPPLRFLGFTLPLGWEGMQAGLLRSARLLTVLLAGQLFAATTDPAELSEALRRLTPFLPRTWSGALASSITLTLSFIPRIMDAALSVRDAALSRGLEQRRSVFRRLSVLALPLVECALRDVEVTTDALLSRCYAENPTPRELCITAGDILLFTAAVMLPVLAACLLP